MKKIVVKVSSLILLLSGLFIASCLTLFGAGSLGDVNSDGNVDSTDYSLMKRYLLNIVGENSINTGNSDLNSDGFIDSTDYAMLKKHLLGIIILNPSTPTPTPTPSPSPTPTPTPKTPGIVKIMPLGDSITDGFNVQGGYRIKLWQLINSNGFKVDFVGSMSNGPSELGDKQHEGHSGWTISQIDTNINSWMDKYKPHIILLHIGTNDMYSDPNGASQRLSALIDKICAKLPTDGKLYVSNIVPFPRNASNVTIYNSKIPGIVQQKASAGKPVFFVEMFNSITSNDLADGIHPNATGYNKMADAWFNAIKNDLSNY